MQPQHPDPRPPPAGRSRTRLGRVVGMMLVGVLSSLGFASSAAAAAKEYQLKAAFLYNFTKFVEWPPKHFRTADQPITIGVLGRDPFAGELELLVKDRKVNGRAISVQHLDTLGGAAVDLLFVPAMEESTYAAFRSQLEAAGTLTVGESARFLPAGGVIAFIPDADKIRFEISIAAAERSRLKISAQLQKLALAVHRKG